MSASKTYYPGQGTTTADRHGASTAFEPTGEYRRPKLGEVIALQGRAQEIFVDWPADSKEVILKPVEEPKTETWVVSVKNGFGCYVEARRLTVESGAEVRGDTLAEEVALEQKLPDGAELLVILAQRGRSNCEGCGRWRGAEAMTTFSPRCLPCRRWRPRPRTLDPDPLRIELYSHYKRFLLLYVPPGLRSTSLPGVAAFARTLGEHERTIRRLLRHEHKRVRLDTADRLCVKLGIHLSEVYP